MRSLIRSKVLVALLSLIIFGLLINVGVAVYTNWVKHQRVANLTAKHRDNLFKVVEKYGEMLTTMDDIDQSEFSQYATGRALLSLSLQQQSFEENPKEPVHRIKTKYELDSAQVISYTENTATLVILEHWESATYNPKEQKYTDYHTRSGWVGYNLQVEDDVWKVSEVGACPVQDESCVEKLKDFGLPSSVGE